MCVCVCVCVCVQAFPGTAPERLIRSARGWHQWTRRNAGTTLVPVAGQPAARGTWHVPPREGLPKFFRTALQVTRGSPQIRNSQVTRVLHQLKIHWGCRSSGVPAARARGEEAVLTWGPPVKVNFKLATPNSVHGCNLARPTWRCMKKGPRVHSARALHVQVFSTHHFLAALSGTRVAPPIPNSQVTRIPYQLKILWGCHCGGVQVARFPSI